MNLPRPLLAGLLYTCSAWAAATTYNAPSYTTASVVNAASYSAAALSPNAIASIYGTWLSYETVALSAPNLVNGGLPTTLGGVTVYVGGSQAGLYYVSPGQINFLMPNILTPGNTSIFVEREGMVGPVVPLTLLAAGPALFSDASYFIAAQHADYSQIDESSPAKPGEVVVLYAEGLGPTIPEELPYALAPVIAPISMLPEFSLMINGVAVDNPTAIYYAGITPGAAGLYQINLRLPANVGANPEIIVQIGASVSATPTHLFVQ